MGSNLLSDSEVEVTPISTPNKEEAILAEAKMLRQHKGRLETRMQILEDHNRQLEAQLQRLRQLLESEPEPSHTSSLHSTGSLPRMSSGGPQHRALHNNNISISSPIPSHRALHHNHTNGSETRGSDYLKWLSTKLSQNYWLHSKSGPVVASNQVNSLLKGVGVLAHVMTDDEANSDNDISLNDNRVD